MADQTVGFISAKTTSLINEVMKMERDILCLAIQCKDEKSGKTGSFIFSPNKPGFSYSPVFSSLIGLFSWLSDNGYSECKGPSILGNYEKVHK